MNGSCVAIEYDVTGVVKHHAGEAYVGTEKRMGVSNADEGK